MSVNDKKEIKEKKVKVKNYFPKFRLLERSSDLDIVPDWISQDLPENIFSDLTLEALNTG
jgi:hypothetical protein